MDAFKLDGFKSLKSSVSENELVPLKLITKRNRQLVEGKRVRLEKDVSETDRFGRLLRYVWVGDDMVNARIVEGGYAAVSTFPPDVRYQDLLLGLQRAAREAGRGLWGACGGPDRVGATISLSDGF